jgi:hypothetical protein
MSGSDARPHLRPNILSQRPYLPLFFFTLVAGALAPKCALAFNEREPIDITADQMEFIESSQTIVAEGNVRVTQSSATLTSDYLRYERGRRWMFAKGHVVMRDRGDLMLGETLEYDVAAQKGYISEARGYNAPWRMQGPKWEREQDHYLGERATATSCQLIDPHYHFRTSRLHLIPDQLFWAWNNSAPFLYKYLADRRVVIRIEPGNDTVNGAFVKTVTTARITPYVYDRFLWDYYTKAGSGFGNELNYRDANERLKGSLFGYSVTTSIPAASPKWPARPTRRSSMSARITGNNSPIP